MTKSIKKDNAVITVKTATRDDFFARGKKIAKMLDEGHSLTASRMISFEDPDDLVKFLTKIKLALLAMLRKHPESISGR